MNKWDRFIQLTNKWGRDIFVKEISIGTTQSFFFEFFKLIDEDSIFYNNL